MRSGVWVIPGTPWVLKSNVERVRLTGNPKVYPWLLCYREEIVTEIGDRELNAALCKSEFAIAQGGWIHQRLARTPSR